MNLHWSTHQLTEYLAAVGASEGESGALSIAVERAAEAFDAEIGAVVMHGEVHGLLGIAPSAGLDLAACRPGGSELIDVPGLGEFHAVTVALGGEVDGTMVIAREHDDFGPEEQQMLQGMARVLGLVVRSLRTLDAERGLREQNELEVQRHLELLLALQTRERLLETLLAIQRAISQRVPLPEVLGTIAAGASSLLDGSFVTLLQVHPVEPDRLIRLAAHGVPTGPVREADVHAAAADAMAADTVVTGTDGSSGDARSLVLAAPVHVGGDRVGAIVAQVADDASHVKDQRRLLRAFGQQVSLALTDARTVETMRQAFHDSLTGLPNRVLFLERLDHALSGEAGTPATVLFLDLDGFKAVNDSLGHQAGDQLLALVARRIGACLRDGDMAARLGGDEFAVHLGDGAGSSDGVHVAQRIIAALRWPLEVGPGEREVMISTSVGIATGVAGTDDATGLLANADVAMYRAKQRGPGHVAVFEAHMHRDLVERLELRAELQRALERDEIWLQYQPVLDLQTGRPTGVEALMRWTHPVSGPVSPADFIPLAEETGAIVELGRWALSQSVRAAVEWRRSFPDLTLNVNVSGIQMRDDRLVGDIDRILRETGLPPLALTLELTETVLMHDAEPMLDVVGKLAALGVRLSIDDFGTGYSSLAYLRHLPVHQVKIDRSLVAGIDTDDDGLAIVAAVVGLARVLGLETVAEGIEHDAQIDALRSVGCPLGQGFHISRPLAAADVAGFLQGHRRLAVARIT